MKPLEGKKVLVSGASIAGLSTAYWLNQLGAQVTVVELASAPRLGGAAINVEGAALDAARRMGILEQLRACAVRLESWEYKDAAGATVGALQLPPADAQPAEEEGIEVERDKLITILLAALGDEVELRFDNAVAALHETAAGVVAVLRDGTRAEYDLVFGCDGLHSGVRRLWFGEEAAYARFMHYYFSLTTVDKLLIRQQTAQLYNVPDKGIMLNAYNGKTDIVFCFFADEELPYDYRDAEAKSRLVIEHFRGEGWRTAELLAEVEQAGTAYFDKFCQIIMPAWTKGRVALVGDAAYCASPAAGTGASLAILGAATVAEALATHAGDYAAAFRAYDAQLRPFIEQVQATALTMLNDYLIPRTEEAIRERNARGIPF